tara:strand:- start:737 stop:1024 length:288 start_codon:yes stop_codon:yes gene_type:complete
MTTRHTYQTYEALKRRLETEIDALKEYESQEMPNDVWEDEARRQEWIRIDREQWNMHYTKLARLQRLYDKCFPKKEWVVDEITRFFESEDDELIF